MIDRGNEDGRLTDLRRLLGALFHLPARRGRQTKRSPALEGRNRGSGPSASHEPATTSMVPGRGESGKSGPQTFHVEPRDPVARQELVVETLADHLRTCAVQAPAEAPPGTVTFTACGCWAVVVESAVGPVRVIRPTETVALEETHPYPLLQHGPGCMRSRLMGKYMDEAGVLALMTGSTVGLQWP